MLRKLLLGTNNPNQIQIIRTALGALPLRLMTLSDLGLYFQILESGRTSLDNACLKAQTYTMITGLACLAIDGRLWIEKLSTEKQSGGRRLHPSAMRLPSTFADEFDYYMQELGGSGERSCTWEGSLALSLLSAQVFSNSYRFQTTVAVRLPVEAAPCAALAPTVGDRSGSRPDLEISPGGHPELPWLRRFVWDHLAEL